MATVISCTLCIKIGVENDTAKIIGIVWSILKYRGRNNKTKEKKTQFNPKFQKASKLNHFSKISLSKVT